MDHIDESGDDDTGSDVPAESGARSQALLDELALAEQERARAEAKVAELMVQVDHARATEAARHSTPRIRALEASSACDDIGLRLGLPAGIVTGKLAELTLVRTHLPSVWTLHIGGLLDGWRIRAIADNAVLLQDPANLTLLDEKLATWLETDMRTPGQVRAWLRRFIARFEPDQRQQRHESTWQRRRACVYHDHDDGTATLQSTLSADDGIAAQDLIDQLARDRANETPGVTAEQACADIVADILLGRIHLDGTSTGTTRVQARIGVVVPVTALTGLSQSPGVSMDRQCALDDQTVRELAALPGTLFRRLLTDDSDNLLEVTAAGYRAPDSLREAIAWRDGACAFPTCDRPANVCDLDHIEPWPEGQTTAHNLQFLCRRHHRLKSHGFLPARDPTGQ